ncbi:MAG: hypothetical protein A3I26_03380 [Candidatus Yanofskybacteria bacterium RIFCSPLOWO2_02_FULL_43_10]|uniref:DUF8128 domain-containing protein n=1 Tax=Candidatus Yanofskybacteria bacterium RIFCSPLOWO2_12_FULL_43_11b TaxID=1802710 RepID=A0A1F8H885_9BACT|nr:MAG: hypothetical protein A2742_00535 [Candidatus Yanofskybacteria bacterium RIFCSPHIGHO2_01_FULL_43_32]OGN11252.1 MAG: hypothetical protein A3C69_00665 [Candidatus Yanofskybacteria bacterium RIFCSPHIGHO2_02_FULL_43_12]OGN17868.1 MAG: hypothetical protein A3E34_00315 [Candidatus Yanofskybacteria bacterium RIFCSPHIGHO2_12_FULL_43_11]OGN24173.1 MAG: hypothetical protein A2923_02475 [Candidatus Yanofskybacteria bacterium RIFCSPLOWO2_01_FULL_43_46]OGN28667.1 MAG: hypothetical protein A3I26_03380
MDQFSFALDSLQTVLWFLAGYWWIFLPVLLFFGLMTAFETYTKMKYIKSIKWTLVNLKIPQDPGKSPKATEQIFAALHGTLPPPIIWRNKFFKGTMVNWISLEIVGIGGETHFYVRMPEQFKKLVQSQIYAHYPDAEISEVADDYVNLLPASLPNDAYDLFGSEIILSKEDFYPIRTYPEFEEKSSGPDYVKRIDPLASLAEVLSSLEAGEFLGVQLIIRPTGDGWVKKGQSEMDKLQGKKSKAGESMLSNLVFEIDKIIPGHVEVEKSEKKPEQTQLTSGKQEAIKAAERKMSKLGYECGIRFMYSGPKENFHRAHISGVVGVFKQYALQTINSFKLNGPTITAGKWPFKKQKEYNKKIFFLNKYKNRSLPAKAFILNIEELATIYHLPDIGVKSPLLPRVEAKKGEPPVGLPIG